MKHPETISLKGVIIAASIATIGIVTLALTAPSSDAPAAPTSTTIRIEPAAPQPLQQIEVAPIQPKPAADY